MPTPTPRRLLWPPIAILLLVVFFTFGSALRFDFVNWDDYEHVSKNPNLNPATWAALGRFWTDQYFGLYIPIPYTLWTVMAAMSPRGMAGQNPFGFHALNLLAHAATVLLVFALLRRLRFTDLPAFFGALLFAVHPVQVEPVAWVAGLRDVLGGLFSIATLYVFLPAPPNPQTKSPPTAPIFTSRYALATFLFILALLSKPTTAVLPLVAILLGRVFQQIPWKRLAMSLAPWCLFSLITIITARYIQPAPKLFHTPLLDRPLIAFDALAFDLTKLVAPIHLSMDYGRSPQWVLNQLHPWLITLLPISLTILLAFPKLCPTAYRVAGAIFLIGVLPTLGLTEYNFQYYSTVADRYLYLAMLGLAVAVAALARQFPRRGVVIILSLIALLFAGLSIRRTQDWRNTFTLCNATLDTNPDSIAAAWILGFEYSSRHDPRAIDYYEHALKAHPDDPLLQFNLGNAYGKVGRPADAIPHYLAALQVNPDEYLTYFYLGNCLLDTQQVDHAIAAYQACLRINPNFAPARKILAQIQPPPATAP